MRENAVDDVDIANEQAQFINDLALQAHFDGIKHPPQHVMLMSGNVVVMCIDCDTAIIAERLRALPNCVRCVDCQELYEMEARR